MPKRLAVMMGTDPDRQGGIASVIRVYRSAGFFERWSIRYLTSHREGPALRKAATAIASAAELLGLAARRRLALVHVHSASRSSFVRKSILLAIARGAGAATLLHLHGGEFETFALREAGPALRRWVRWTLQRSSAVIVLTESWRATVLRIAPAARVVVIPNPVDVPGEAAPPEAREGRRILFLGRAERPKGVFQLVEAAAQLAREFPDLVLVVAGAGDLPGLRRHAEELGAGGMLETLGWIGPAERRRELRRALAFALPSFHEGLPVALLEAMAEGCPVVTTPVGGIPDLVRDGEEGLLVPPGDVGALAGALRRLLSDAALRARLGRAARATVAARHATGVVFDELSRLYQDVLARRR